MFQFQARIIASGVFVRDERFEKARKGQLGVLHFEAGSFRTFEPVDVEGMRRAWPRFRGFGHVKQALNPGMYGAFKRRLRDVRRAGWDRATKRRARGGGFEGKR